ncbi:lipopolysaccharide biosynthesis protein [Streptomyces sp. G-G2]|uniref:lipopolysaccharide biosynthesis protein n=1 Tax=Streptomyces sp. G-G2 TaxID=3046201 RepID=UPI0024B9E59F|nr:lipopolysaccharide biosynthesis protein [Streptomyces sp. G-G2]MDJ0380508.1 lipopolysaccharide biosynthesis protein [Streptomyces sp. G-G2]
MAETPDHKKTDRTPEQSPAPRRRRGHRVRGRLRPLPVWWPLPACALLGLAAGGAYGVLKAPEYAATSYVVAVPGANTEPATALGFAQAYGRIATSSSTLAYAQPRAGIAAEQLRTQVRAETSPESPMIAITGTSRTATGAADIANAVADALSLSSNTAAKNTGVQLLLFNQAVAPTDPASPSAPLSGAVGLCAGGLIGGLWLLARPGRKRRRADGTVAADGAVTAAGHAESGYVTSLPAQGEAADAAASAKEKESVR